MTNRPRAFEERLRAALLARLPEVAPAPTPTRVRRYGVPLAVGVATAAVVAVMALPGSTHNGTRPADGPAGAPEIRKDPDGSLRFKMPEPGEIPALVDALKKLGVPAALVPKRPPSQCSAPGGGYRGPQTDREAEVLQESTDGFVFKVDAKTVPPGHSLAFEWAEYHPLGEKGIGVGVIETSKVPSCAVDHSEGLEELLKSGSGAPTGEPADTIRVPVPTVDELPELVRRLQTQGVNVAVTEKKAKAECPHVGGGYRGPQADPEAELRGRGREPSTLKINSKTVPPGYTLVFSKPADPRGQVGAGVKETSKVTPCEIDYSAGDPERARLNAELQSKLRGTPATPPAGTSPR
ncbi:hypothetical protein ACFV7Q_35515 [Streptomyces sp. NPDC059851]|uniref:hypothetical protein n=1 Tax=Streptomyces sp. NPDC059851 TaxID=3346971 RepID=UPI003665AD7D